MRIKITGDHVTKGILVAVIVVALLLIPGILANSVPEESKSPVGSISMCLGELSVSPQMQEIDALTCSEIFLPSGAEITVQGKVPVEINGRSYIWNDELREWIPLTLHVSERIFLPEGTYYFRVVILGGGGYFHILGYDPE